MTVKPNKKGVVTGTKANDKITWVNTKDWQKALTVNAGAGKDTIDFRKSKYKNTLNGDAGNDTIYGGTNADMIRGGAGTDSVDGGAGNDRIFGLKGNDILKGGAGNDFIDGGDDNDKIYGDAGDDKLYGNAGNDTIEGGAGYNMLFGQSGNDSLKGGNDKDLLDGSSGNDTMIGNGGADTIRAGAGDDYAEGGSGNDQIVGHSGNDTLKGGDGDDFIDGGNGNDSILGGAGKDLIRGGSDNDYIDGGDGDDNIQGQFGNNTLIGGKGNDTVFGGKGNDYIEGGEGNDNIQAREGDDTIYGGKGHDIINAGAGNNRITYEAGDGNDTIISGGGNDTIAFSGMGLADLSGDISKNGDAIIYYGANGENVVLKDYIINKHSVTYVETGGGMKDIESFLGCYVGTNSADTISLDHYDEMTSIYALDGNDSISVSGYLNEYNPKININGGKGDDNLSLEHASANLLIDTNSGNDTISGVGMCYGNVSISGGTSYKENYYMEYGEELLEDGYLNTLYLNVIANPDILLRDGGIKPYILAERADNDLIIKLTNGQTTTIKNFFSTNNSYALDNSLKYLYSGTGINGSSVYDIIKWNEINLTRLTPENNSVDLSSSTETQVICAEENADYTVTVGNGNSNEIYIMADGDHDITLGNGYDNYVTVAKYDINGKLTQAIEGNVNITSGNGEDTHIKVYATGDVNVNTTGDKSKSIYVKDAESATITCDDANISAFAKNQNIITTGIYDSKIETGYDDGVTKSTNTITSNGDDYITIVGGQSDITLIGEGTEKRIAVAPNAQTTLNGVLDVKSVTLEYANGYESSIYNYENFQELVFTHYKSEDTYNANDELVSGYVTVYGLDDNGSLIGEGIRINGSAVEGTNFLDLDSYDYTKNKAVIDDKLTLRVYNRTAPYQVNYKLSGIAQYVDMAKIGNEFDVDEVGMNHLGNSFIVQGSAYDDIYWWEVGTKVTITEAGYFDNDELRIQSDLDEFRMFFDVSVYGSTPIIGRDLIICSYGYSTAEFNDLFDSTKKDSVHTLTIKDYLMTDPIVDIETVKSSHGSDNYTLNRTNLMDTSNTDSIVSQVISWLNAHDSYSSVSEAIADSNNLSQADLESLISCYSGGANYINDYWNLV